MNLDYSEFLRIEKEYSLHEKSIDGIRYWHYVRCSIVAKAIVGNLMDLPSEQSDVPRSRKWKTILKGFWGMFIRPYGNVDILFVAHNRRQLIDGKYKCIYTDDIAKLFPNSWSLEYPYRFIGNHMTPAVTDRLIYSDGLEIPFFILRNTYRNFHFERDFEQLKNKVYSQLHDAIESMALAYRTQVDMEAICYQIATGIITYYRRKKILCSFLKHVNPKVIVETVYYSEDNMIINDIAHELGIPIVELQHGATDIEYRTIYDGLITQMPDCILTFSSFWNSMMRLPDSIKTTATGFPFFEERIKEFSYKMRSDDRITILFISQPIAGVRLFINLVIRFADLVSEKGYRLIYKLHPMEYDTWKRNYAELMRDDIEVISNEVSSIYELFAVSDYQVGMDSTALFEGLGFGLKTLVFNQRKIPSIDALSESGYAVSVNSEVDLVKAIEEFDALPEKKEQRFWEPNALWNIKKVLDDILSSISSEKVDELNE